MQFWNWKNIYPPQQANRDLIISSWQLREKKPPENSTYTVNCWVTSHWNVSRQWYCWYAVWHMWRDIQQSVIKHATTVTEQQASWTEHTKWRDHHFPWTNSKERPFLKNVILNKVITVKKLLDKNELRSSNLSETNSRN